MAFTVNPHTTPPSEAPEKYNARISLLFELAIRAQEQEWEWEVVLNLLPCLRF